VEHDWNPETTEELSLVKGETVIVLDKAGDGWWSGITTSQGVPKRGYFPMNYLRSKTGGASTSANPVRKGTDFSISSLDAFDALVEKGFAVEYISRSESGKHLHLGSRVEATATVLTWDGATTEATVGSEGPLAYTVGALQVPIGLDEASLSLQVGDDALVILAPGKAFGYAGHPPLIPPNSHVVYSIRVTGLAPMDASTAAATPAVGNPAVLNSGVSTVRSVKGAASDGANRRSLVLDLSGEKRAGSDGGTEISDAMLAQAAASMGLSAGASEK